MVTDFVATMAKVKDSFDREVEGERELNYLLSSIIETKEQVEQNTRENRQHLTEEDILQHIFPYLVKILRNRPLNGRFLDTRYELRKNAYTILQLYQNYIQHNEMIERYRELVSLCFMALRNDSEEIADIAVKILGQFVTQQSTSPRKIQLSEFREQITTFCQDFLGFLANVTYFAKTYTQKELEETNITLPTYLKDVPNHQSGSAQKTFTTYGCRSWKLAAKFIHQLLRQYWNDTRQERIIESVKEQLFDVFKSDNLSEDINNQNLDKKLKAIPFFTKGLENMSILFHTVQFLLPNTSDQMSSIPSFKSNIEYLRHNFGQIIHFFIILAKGLPGHATEMRYQALVGFYSVYNKTLQLTSEDETHREIVANLKQTVENVLHFYLNQLLDAAVLLGQGQVTYQIVHESANLVYRLFELLKEKMSPYQLAKAMQMLLHCLLNPLTPLILKSTIIFCLYKFNVELKRMKVIQIKCPEDTHNDFQNYDLQLELLSQMTILCKRLDKQTAQGVQFFQEKGGNPQPTTKKISEDSMDDIFVLREKDLEEACNQSFKLSWDHICSTVDPQYPKTPNVGVQQEFTGTLAQKKEHYSRTAKNLFLFVENILIFLKELQGRPTLSLEAMQYVQKFFVYGCNLIQSLSEILGPQEEPKMKEVCKSFQILLHQLRIQQFRDLLQASGDKVFGLIVECKAKGKEGGVSLVSKYFMQFSQSVGNTQHMSMMVQGQKHPDDWVSVYLDMFFNYIKEKIEVFDPKNEENPEMRFGLSKQDKKLAEVSFAKVQEIMQKKLLFIGEQCLHRANDIRVKHTFFGVFMFCIQQIRSGYIAPRYFTIIRNLWKEICNLDEQSVSIKEIMRDFIPMVQGLIETFLQQKDEVTYIKYTKEICCFVPAKLKHLLDYLPAISKPLVENMESNSPEQVESGIHTLQYWLTALATYPELFDPVISHVLPELNACLKPLLTYMPNISLKLMGKLGAKTRQYDRNNEFKPRNYSEDGLKITLTDKHSKEQIVFGIDAIIDVLLIKILSYGEQFQPTDLKAAVAFVKCAFLTYIDKDFDMDYVIASIVQAKNKDNLQGFAVPPINQSFDARKPQEPISQMTHGSESHVFEKILRCLIIGCSSLPIHTPEFQAVAKEHTQFMKWVTQYFTLIYVAKNKTLTHATKIDEINPLIFLDYICEFLYYNINQGLIVKKKDKSVRPYYKGSSFAIKTMLRLLTHLYADQTNAFDNLEIIPILIQKICSQVDELPKNLAVNIAIQILIKELPQRTLKKNCQVILKTLFQILTQSPDSVVLSVQAELKPTINMLFEAIGIYQHMLERVTLVEDRAIFNSVVDRIMQNLLSPQQAARSTAKHFLVLIAERNNKKVSQLMHSVPRNQASESVPQGISWHDYLYEFEIERKVKDCFDMLCGGYSLNLQLIQFIEIIQFMLQYGDPEKVDERKHVFIGIADFMLIALEDEAEKFESILEQDSHPVLGANMTIMKLTKRYMKLERIYLQQNKEYDSYAHTMHTHQFLTTHFFEVTSQAKEAKLKKDLENLNGHQSNVEHKIFEKPQPNQQSLFDRLTDDAKREISSLEEMIQVRGQVKKKIEDFTIKMFQQKLRVQDISYQYMHSLYEIYPNVRLHCQLTSKILELICDIVLQPKIHDFIKAKQTEYFETYGAQESGQEVLTDMLKKIQHLRTRFDFYVVEIKAKIICMQFKFFQRDELIIHKKAKQCLKRLLRQDGAPNEALPNFILKECVRPILNSLSSNRTASSSFQHLGKLIKVCYSCFNEALAKHLTANYKTLEMSIKEDYQYLRNIDYQRNRNEIQEEVLMLVENYNIKVQQIETAIGIISSLHHLCQSKPNLLPDIPEVMMRAFHFEVYLVEEFDKKFEDALWKLLRENDPHKLSQLAYDKMSPLLYKVGYLRSDLRNGVAKFFNLNYKGLQEILSREDQQRTIVQIVGQRENFGLRERLSRDTWIRSCIHTARQGSMLNEDKLRFEDKYVLAINMVYIFSKFHPQYLMQQRNVQILDGLRDKWINKAHPDAFLQNDNKDLYFKIQKSLVIYSRNEKSEIQILFDLLKDFQLSSVNHDMKPLVQLCTQEIPLFASTQKKIKILEAALEKLQKSNCKFEAKYSMFEFAFMPIALQCANDAAKFREIFGEGMIRLFIGTFFATRRDYNDHDQLVPDTMWRQIHAKLEQRQQVSYQSFYMEIVKVLMIILKHSTFKVIEACCPQEGQPRGCMLIYHFLDWVAKNATDQYLREHAFYTMSCFGVRMLNLKLADEEKSPDDDVEMTWEQPTQQGFFVMLADNVLAPFFEIELVKVANKTIIKHTLTNLVTIFQDPRVYNQNVGESKFDIWHYFKRRYSLKPLSQYRLSLCTLIAIQSMQCEVQDIRIYRRLQKSIKMFVSSNYQGVSVENLPDCNQPLILIDAVLRWLKQLKERAISNEEKLNIQNQVNALHNQTQKLFDLCLNSIPTQITQNIQPQQITKAREIFQEIATHSLQVLQQIGTMYPMSFAYNATDQNPITNINDLDKIQYKFIYNLNQCGMALQEGFDLPNTVKFLFEFLKANLSFSFVNFRLILYPIHLIKALLTSRALPQQLITELRQSLREQVELQVIKALQRDLKQQQGLLVRDYLRIQGAPGVGNQQQILQNSKNEEIKVVQRLLPHFSIRAIQALEQLRDQGFIPQQEFAQWVPPIVYKNLSDSIFRIVSFFRQVVTQEKPATDQFNSNKDYRQTYCDFPFLANQLEFCLDDPNYDAWIKETIMIGIKSIIVHMKQILHQDDAFIVNDNIKTILKIFFQVKTCGYMLEQLYEIVKLLVVDSPMDRTRLIAKEKASWLMKLINAHKLKEITDAKENENSLVNRVYALCLDFLESQQSLLQNDTSLKIYDRLFWLKPCCTYRLRQRMFSAFEKFQGSALKHKLQYFMYKVSSEDFDQYVQFSQINNLLDFTLFNFKQDVSIYSIRDSSKLMLMHSRAFRFIVPDHVRNQQSFQQITGALEFFGAQISQYRQMKLENLLMPLSEIIRINPEHSHDRDIAGKIFSKIFWQYWQKILQRQDHAQFASDFNKMTQNMVKFNSVNTVHNKTQFARTMLEQIVALNNPQVRVEPEVLQYLAKHFNLWHLAIPMLEDHVQLFPQNERYVFALQELYQGLMEEDLSMGLSRLTTKSPEMRSLYTYAQHQMWEEINVQFSQYINFYAEQEGLFSYLETQQQTPGKYSRQLARYSIIDMINGVDPLLHITRPEPPSNRNFSKVFETEEVQKKLAQDNFPKVGSNRNISELDLRTWETLYIQSLKILKKNELFRDIAENMSDLQTHELRIDYFWSVKDMRNLKVLLDQLLGTNGMQNPNVKRYQINPGSIQKVRYHLYQNYILGIQGDRESHNFDENFKETVKLAIRQWSEFLPSYMDRIQNEYLILFQQIMESNEGGRNMINNQNIQVRKLSEFRCAMNIWRERLPNSCESMQTWQDILESRNFIFTKLRDNIIRQRQLQEVDIEFSIASHEEPVDICWNELKLASVSRKHGLYGLAQYYLNNVKKPLLDPQTKGDKLMLERFRYVYETNKLQMLTFNESSAKQHAQQELIRDNASFIANPDYDLWMHAEIMRLQGEQFLAKGDLTSAKQNLLNSINMNQKEAKTWMSYAKLNQIVHSEKKDERSATNALKGYFCATSLQQHKARLIIPFILRVLKARHNNNPSPKLISYIKLNVDQLPTWLWLFWIPQLLRMLEQKKKSLQHESAYTIMYKLCRLYPQPTYYPIIAKRHYHKSFQKDATYQNQREALKNIETLCKKAMRVKNPKLLDDSIEVFIAEMSDVFKNQDETFLYILLSILNFSQFYLQKDIELKLTTFYKQVIATQINRISQTQVKEEFQKYFINAETMETSITQQMILLKNFKDYMLIQKNLKSQTQTLEEIFPRLASLCVKGMQLPDQFITSAQEPLPEKVITIQRIDQTVHRSGTNDKKIQFRCSDGKALAYTFSNLKGKKPEKDYLQFLSDDRVNQMKLVMNMLFLRHKESTRRGIKFHVAPRTLLPGSKMTQEDLSFTDFQETHDYLLLEQGVDPDSALLSQLSQINQIFEAYPPSQPQVLFSLDATQIQQMNLNTHRHMCSQVEPYLLQSYFNRIFYNHDNLFIFKKQFTKYHAVNSLFAYAFNQSEFLRLNTLNFCKATGCLNFTETKLQQAVCNSAVFSRKSFEEIESEQFKIQVSDASDQIHSNSPFRLTPNLVHFMGQIGLHGIFAGVMTSASLALTQHEEKLLTMLKLIFSDEIAETPDAASETQTVKTAEFAMFKLKSLSQHKRILEQAPRSEELRAKSIGAQQLPGIAEDRQTGNFVLGTENPIQVPRELFDLEMEQPMISEEFNKKVFELIEMAQDEARLSQKPMNWCSWF